MSYVYLKSQGNNFSIKIKRCLFITLEFIFGSNVMKTSGNIFHKLKDYVLMLMIYLVDRCACGNELTTAMVSRITSSFEPMLEALKVFQLPGINYFFYSKKATL